MSDGNNFFDHNLEIILALPHLVKHIYNNASDEVIRRGKKIYSQGFVELIDHDYLMNSTVFRTRDDVYNTYYRINITRYTDAKQMTLRCSCPYNIGDLCRHEVASLLRLQDMVDKNQLHSENIRYDQRHTVAKMKQIDLKMLRMLSSPAIYQNAESLLRTNRANILHAANERVEAELHLNGNNFPLVIQKNDERNFDTSCLCTESNHPLCEHKVLLFLQLLHNHGADYFDSIRNWEKEKGKLLQIYGYSLNDDLKGKFEFVYKDGKPFLKVLDPSIKRVETGLPKEKAAPFADLKPLVAAPQKELKDEKETLVEEPGLRLGTVFNLNTKTYPYFQFDLMAGKVNEEGNAFLGKIEKLDLVKFIDTESYTENDRQVLQQVRKLQDFEVNKYLNKNSPFSGIWENIIHQEGEALPDETKALVIEYLHPRLLKFFDENEDNTLIYILPKGKAFKTANLQDLKLNNHRLKPTFRVNAKGNDFELSCKVKLPHDWVDLQENQLPENLLFLYDDELYNWEDAEDILVTDPFLKKGSKTILREQWVETMENTVLPLTKSYDVEFEKSLVREVRSEQPEVKLMLKEKGEHLLFQPVFYYNGISAGAGQKDTFILPDGDKLLRVIRNKDFEEETFRRINNLHSSFLLQPEAGSLALKGVDVLKNNWFFLFVEAMKDMKIPVFGFESLKNFRFNTTKPNTHIHLSSGVDWFDAKIEIQFGEQRVGIAEIKHALAAKQSFVQLSDGTLGILPDEWLKKYSLMLRMGEGKTDKLRLSKYHMSIIDELYENRNEEELSFALDEKYERLMEFKNIPETEPPEELVDILRPYQKAGFQWINYLKDVGWGGILADDMGLGKTIQALTALRDFYNTNDRLLALVVCPTTLIYNWENEIQKFTPALTHHIHHGNLRTRNTDELSSYNIIITTYGTLRSDVQLLMKLNFDYLILDESQAIKNPASKVTKAATLLNASNRLCMSGTPLQNNTFDIYAQMNFLNPGLLGTMEFFRNEFATPIDKFGEKEQKDHLRKLLYPFILRRTKEQVAKDLPEKTETTLFCEMGREQRRIYDAYRNTFREKILGSIEERGIDRSQLTILQGLMKLRQICDSPAILNEDEKFPNYSIKLEELAREISENIGDHKALVFSQFIGMLSLIKEKLKELNIPFEYFDGSTSAVDREKAIQHFQNTDDCRVFLISLKAGGVGLNLTAADYVYLVDPWWNPAVEQQAIDRTHRIGQTKNIFAYRMICMDTIEDKILELQERKKTLARELITDDSGFVKTLSRADVEYLFS